MCTLTARQAEVLATIDRLTHERGCPPTFHELMAAVGIRWTNGLLSHLKALEKKGFLVREFNRTRALSILRRIDGDRLLHRGRWVAPGETIEYDGGACIWQPLPQPLTEEQAA